MDHLTRALAALQRRFRARPAVARPRIRSLALLLIACAALGVVLNDGDALNAAPVRAAEHGRQQPDIVVILTDDQRTDSLLSMSSVRSLLVDRGTRFTNGMVPTSICCPSRSTILTGLFSHSTGVWDNGGQHGGWRTFQRLGLERKTIALALDRAGYRTGLIGKYLNGFGHFSPTGYKPAGWDTFEGFRLPRKSGAYYDYSLGGRSAFGAGTSDYSTDVLATRAVNFIWSTPRGRSLFLYFAPFAPHNPYAPAPRHLGALAGVLPSYHPASVTASVGDKPLWVQRRPEVRQARIDYIRERQGESLMAVDEAVAAIVAALEHSGRLHDTMIVFMSDNGLMTGEHHIVGKNVPYAASTSIPLVIRWDGRVPAGAVDDRLALNVDVASTVAHAAKVSMKTEGSSLLGQRRRDGFVLESDYSARYARPAYCGWRTASWMYVHYSGGEEELYDYATDPDEVHNLAKEPGYATQLAAMRADAQRGCRPTPPSFRW
jgi:arylsulfatase A-like enzyme